MHDGDIWELGDVVVDLATQRVRRPGGGETRLTPRAAAVLRALIRAGDRPLSREALLSEVWGEAEIGDEVLSKAINELRLALGDHDTRRRRFIETIPKRGYRLICGARALMSIPTDAVAATVTTVVASTDSVPIDATALGVATAESADDGPAAASNPGSNVRLPPERPSPEQNTAPVPAGAQTSTASAAMPRASQSPAPPSPSRRRWSVVAALLPLLAVAAVAVWPRARDGEYSAATLRAAFAAPPRTVAAARDYLGYVDVLPDGSRALYAAPDGDTVRVVTRDLDGRPARRISALNGGAEFAPAVSPDGRTIAYQHFVDGGCRIRLHALADGSERDLAGCNPRFAEWLEFSPDGQFLLTPRMRAGDTAMSLHRIALDDGKVGAWDYPHDAAISDVQARHSPDGSQLAIRRGAQPHSSLWLLDLRRGTQRELVDDGFGLDGYAWLPDGSALLVGAHDGAGAGLWRVDARSGERVYLGLRGATCPVVAAGNGALLFTRSARRYALMRIGVDGNAETDPPQAFATSVGADWYPRLSADGRHVAFLSDRDGPVAVYVADTDGGRPQRLPDLPGLVPQARPAFTPDARRVLVPMRGTDGHGALYETSLDAPHWQRIGEAAGDVEQVLVPVDGRWTYYVVRDVNGDRALWRRSRESGAEQHLVDNLARGPIDGDAHGGIYYVDAARQALLRRDPDDGRNEPWLDDMGYWTAYAWTVAGDQVYALREPAGRDFGLYRIGLGQTPQLVEPMDGISPLGIAVAADGAALLLARPPRGAQELVWLPLPAPEARR